MFCTKTNLASLKTEVDKLDIGKLTTVPVDLSELSNVVKNDFVKKLFMTNSLEKKIILILVILFQKPNIKQTEQN